MPASEIDQRLDQLRQELDKGRQTLAELDSRAAVIRSQMLRISGAIQVLEELQAAAAPAPEHPLPRVVAAGA